MNGNGSTAGRATHLLPPNMAESTTHTEGDLGLVHGVHITDTETPQWYMQTQNRNSSFDMQEPRHTEVTVAVNLHLPPQLITADCFSRHEFDLLLCSAPFHEDRFLHAPLFIFSHDSFCWRRQQSSTA